MTINADDLDHLKEIINNQIEASTKKMLVYLDTYIKVVEQDLKEKQDDFCNYWQEELSIFYDNKDLENFAKGKQDE